MSLQLITSDNKSPSMMECPKWDSCGAPICPLNGVNGPHLSGEEVCPYLREAAKGVNGVPPSGLFSREIMNAAKAMWANKTTLPFQLRKVLNRASKSGSKRSSSTLISKAA